MIAINAKNFNLDKAKQVTMHGASYYVFTADNGQKFIVMHGSTNGKYDVRCESALGTFKNAIVICCHPVTMRESGLNTLGDWDTVTTFAYDGETVYVMGAQ